MKDKLLLPFNLQFFAEGEDGQEDQNDNAEDQNQQTENNQEGNSGEKTFTQAELTARAAAEKKQGKNSILKLFGLKDEKSAKEQAEAFKKWQESQQTLEDKVKDSEGKLSESEKRATEAEAKLSCMMAGVNKDSLEDALAIAITKVTDDKDLDTVLEEMKTQAKYKGFFENNGSEEDEESKNKGTGKKPGNTKKSGEKNIGARLAEARTKNQSQKKSSYFSN